MKAIIKSILVLSFLIFSTSSFAEDPFPHVANLECERLNEEFDRTFKQISEILYSEREIYESDVFQEVLLPYLVSYFNVLSEERAKRCMRPDFGGPEDELSFKGIL